MFNNFTLRSFAALVAVTLSAAPALGQPAQPATPNGAPPASVPAGATLPPGYVIGPEDVLSIVFWRDADMSAEVAVRPDGKVSLPLLNDVTAAGLTPDQLRESLAKAAKKFIADPTVTVVVRTINSRKVFITGNVQRPGAYALTGTMTVLQLIAMSGGVLEYADAKNIVVMRNEEGGQKAYPFNYKDIAKRRNLSQNIELKPGDTVIVP
jgi:polysaccharide export outer membrane protein